MKSFRKIADGPIEYHVDEVNRVVVAFMYDTECIALDYVIDCGSIYKEGVVVAPLLADEDRAYLIMEPKYSARTRCHPDDKFDVEEGKKIARKKLLKNVHKAFDKRLRRYAKHLEECQKQLVSSLDGIEY